MKPQLYTGLRDNGAELSENYQLWSKETMIGKIAMVMGLQLTKGKIRDPDPSYVLTVDNVIKMLAIQMRFRCIITHSYTKLYNLMQLISLTGVTFQ